MQIYVKATDVLFFHVLYVSIFRTTNLDHSLVRPTVLAYTEIDSYVYHIFHTHLYAGLKEMIFCFDTSGCPQTNQYGTQSHKVLAKKKNELRGIPLQDFVV